MREICKSGSEGGGGVSRSLPLSSNETSDRLEHGLADHGAVDQLL
jgi:hypothetical protein